MDIAMVTRSFGRTKATHGPARVVPLPSLTANIDHLAELRGLIRQAQDEERRLTAEVLGLMQAAGLDRLEGQQAVAIRDVRTVLKADPELLHTALGARAFAAMTVSVTAARRLVGADELAAISETTTTPALRVEALTEPREVL